MKNEMLKSLLYTLPYLTLLLLHDSACRNTINSRFRALWLQARKATTSYFHLQVLQANMGRIGFENHTRYLASPREQRKPSVPHLCIQKIKYGCADGREGHNWVSSMPRSRSVGSAFGGEDAYVRSRWEEGSADAFVYEVFFILEWWGG